MAQTLSQACCCLALLGAACSGSITSTGADAAAAPPTGIGNPSGAAGSTSVATRPERSTPDGIGWATRFPKLSNEQWEYGL